jgi:hypothetical protein
MIKLKCEKCGFPISMDRKFIHSLYKNDDKYFLNIECCNCDSIKGIEIDLYYNYLGWMKKKYWDNYDRYLKRNKS